MPTIRLSTSISAPPERVVDLSRNIDALQESALETKERAIGGVTHGLIGLNEEVTWEAYHFGFKQRLAVRIITCDRPTHFQDIMIAGTFKSMKHDHEFSAQPGGTLIVDRFEFESSFGILGHIVNRLFLTKYMRRFLIHRNQVLKNLAESEDWRKYVS